MARTAIAVAMALMLVVAGCTGIGGDDGDGTNAFEETGAPSGAVDDGGDVAETGAPQPAEEPSEPNVGYSVGGAKDVNDFRNNVREGYLPQRASITHHGLFYDYHFDTGEPAECRQLFCPTYSQAVSEDPLSGETEQFMTVGLNSNISRSDLQRKKLNLVVVLDVSGSMSESFDRYYYDDDGQKVETERRPKMEAAKESLLGMVDHLKAGDRFGLVTYEGRARTAVQMGAVGDRDMESVRERIRSLSAGGSTNLAAGMDRARAMIEPYADADPEEYETRIVYVTDAMPNVGDTSAEGLEARLREDARQGVYSTFVGVGIDFNSRLVETISDVKGANYYTVKSAAQFRERMDEEFEYMVTPLVFDLSLSVESEGYAIQNVYGAPSADEASGEILHVNTLFPSPTTDDGSTKGGVILVELARTGEAAGVTLTASYEDRNGNRHEVTRRVSFQPHEPEYFENDGIRKAVLLSRYATLMQNWIAHERARLAGETPGEPPQGIEDRGGELGEWEQQSADLQVSPTYRERIRSFKPYFEREVDAIGDETLRREVTLLEELASQGQTESTRAVEAAA